MFFAASSACRFKLASTYYTRYVLPAKSGAISPSCHVPCRTKPAAIAFGFTYRSVVVIPLSWYISDKLWKNYQQSFPPSWVGCQWFDRVYVYCRRRVRCHRPWDVQQLQIDSRSTLDVCSDMIVISRFRKLATYRDIHQIRYDTIQLYCYSAGSACSSVGCCSAV